MNKYRVWVMFGWFATKKHDIVHANSIEEARAQFIKGCPVEVVAKISSFGFWLKIQKV